MLEELLAKLLGGGQGFAPPQRQPGDALSPSELGVPQGGLMALLGGGSPAPQQPQQQAQPQQTQELSAQSRQASPMPAPASGGINFGDMLSRLGPALMMMSGDPNFTKSGALMAAQNSKNRQTAQEQQQAQQRMTQTYQWLTGARGMDPQQAALIAQDPTALREYLKPKEQEKPEYKVVGKDQFGHEQYGWVYKGDKKIEPLQQQAPQQQGQSAIPPAPPGVDPVLWNKQHSESAAAKATGPKPEDVSKLRNEVQGLPSYKNMAQAAPIYHSMMNAAGRDTRAADVNMIYGLAKIMDPTSVVRESEMTVAQAVATLPQYLQANIQSQLQATGRLSPDVRQAIMEEAHSRVSSYKKMFDTDMGMYGGIVERNRMNRSDVIPDFGSFDSYKAAPPAGSAPASQPSRQQIEQELRKRGALK